MEAHSRRLEGRDSDPDEYVELVLRRRLQALRKALRAARDEVVGRSASIGDSMARGLLVTRWIETFDAQSQRALADLLAVAGRAESGEAADDGWTGRLGEHLDRYLDSAEDALRRGLSEGGAGVSSTERKRIDNSLGGVRAGLSARLEADLERLARSQARAAGGELADGERDDRLPLARAAAFDRDVERLVAEAQRHGEELALILADLDRFKSVNDDHGHAVGDEVLVAAAERLAARTLGKGKSYRYGGEELAVLLPGWSIEEAMGMAERLRKDLASAPMSSARLDVTASFGVAALAGRSDDAKALFARADTALYRAKAGGRNQVRAEGGKGAVEWADGQGEKS